MLHNISKIHSHPQHQFACIHSKTSLNLCHFDAHLRKMCAILMHTFDQQGKFF